MHSTILKNKKMQVILAFTLLQQMQTGGRKCNEPESS